MSTSFTSESSRSDLPIDAAAQRGHLGRRDFLRVLGAGTTALLAFRPWAVAMAGPFTRDDFHKLVPADKRLSAEWLASLTARGEREVYRGPDLTKIGLPIGGICAGQLYLGGDGRLWHWDIFNKHVGTGAEHYAKPMLPASPLEQGFALSVTAEGQTQERRLEASHWKSVEFIGEYPIGKVSYADPDCPVGVTLEAFSPFIPLNTDDSSLPATVFEFTLLNRGTQAVDVELAGWLENAVCLHSGQKRGGTRRNRLVRDSGLLFMECAAEEVAAAKLSDRPDVVFDDFERERYETWTVSGEAFGNGPVEAAKMPDYQGDVAAKGKRLVNSHATAPGHDVGARDDATGRLTSRPFTIDRHFITFLIGGGNHRNTTCINLLVNDEVVLSATGPANNKLIPMSWDVRAWVGKSARLVVVDDQQGAWGNIGIDDIVFSDNPRVPIGPMAEEEDFGTMGLALLQAQTADSGMTNFVATNGAVGALPQWKSNVEPATTPFGNRLVGAILTHRKLAPGTSATATFVLTWHFPNLKMNRLPPGRYYGTRFNSALDVAKYVAANSTRLNAETRLWHKTWYDSTLPFWFLNRTFLNTSILATSTCRRLGDGRFYAYEGVGCCEGTCGHVWQYAHAMARLFPDLERSLREKVDFGLAQQPDGSIHFRGEFNDIPAIDAQAGTVLRALREHQMTTDSTWLRRYWPKIRRATEWLIGKDADADGIISSNQHNTLDTDWFGPVAWLSGLYLAALGAAAEMANTVGDNSFADRCRHIAAAGQKELVRQLFVDGYFINRVNDKHLDAINSGTGCHIDQVMGQSWAFQVGLPRVLPEKETRQALASLWRYNFTPDVGPYREAYKAGRWYAMPGEAGLLMCTFPRSDWDYAQAKGKGPEWAAGYFNECMNGFEYQVAGHMIWEGMLTEGLAITRAVHDRYHPSRRNPYNEIECGDHYARSMASYGVFLAACGYRYDGPSGYLGFAPKLSPEKFKAPFTTAKAWGSFTQERSANAQTNRFELKYGEMKLQRVALEIPSNSSVAEAKAENGGSRIVLKSAQVDSRVELSFDSPVTVRAGAVLEIKLTLHA